MRIAVLGSADSWYLRDLQRAAADRDEVVPLPFSALVSQLASGVPVQVASRGENLARFDAVLVRTMPPGSLEQVIFRMDALGQFAAAGGLVVNSPRAIEAAVDKYLTSAKLHAAGLLTPPTAVCQTVEEAVQAFQRLGGDVVLKPLFGSEGRGIARLVDAALAERAFQLLVQLGSVIYLQQFISHPGYDYRVLVLGDRVLGMQRSNTLDWRTNVSRGATAEPLEVTPALRELAIQAAGSVGAVFAGVDILPDGAGNLYVIEVNAVPGWKALARTLEVDVARLALDYLHEQVDRRRQAAA